MSKVQRLRDELSLKLDDGSLNEQGLARLRERLGNLVIKALDDEVHPLAVQLRELRALIDLHRPKAAAGRRRKKRDSPPPTGPMTAIMTDAHFFMPHPGISLPVKRYWPLQLLLHEAACSSFREAVAFRLEIDPDKIGYCVKQAEKFSTDYWSWQQYGSFLDKALPHLDAPEPPLRLAGIMLLYGGRGIRLSRQQAEFVRLLIERTGQWVTHDQFEARGIHNPAKIFYTLNQKTKAEEISLPIHSKAGAYMLANVA